MHRPLVRVSAAGLVLGLLLAAIGAWQARTGPDLRWFQAHGSILLAGFLLPASAALHVQQVAKLTRGRSQAWDIPRLAALYGTAALFVATGKLLQPGVTWELVSAAGMVFLVAGAMIQAKIMADLRATAPGSLVDLARDPLTKGDDACMKQIRFAHMMLPIGLAFLAASNVPDLWDTMRLRLTGYHLILAGYGLLSAYGISHVVVPRLSGVPAIAPGAIKGELHSSLLGIVLLSAGFLGDIRGLLIAGGAFLFLGAFTWMGVLGANIMRNKSKTQRVTPEFVYVPWTFAAVFWTISGVLLGIFLTVAPGKFPETPEVPAVLRFVHIHALLFGGFTLLFLGFVLRLAAAILGKPPPSFQKTKLSFYGVNAGLVLAMWGYARDGPADLLVLSGAFLTLASLAAYFMSLPKATTPSSG